MKVKIVHVMVISFTHLLLTMKKNQSISLWISLINLLKFLLLMDLKLSHAIIIKWQKEMKNSLKVSINNVSVMISVK